MKLQTRLFIGGEFVEARRGGTIETLNPHDNSKLAAVAEATEPDVDDAVSAASKAFPAWRDTAAADRGRLIAKLADAIEAHRDELAEVESLDTGHPIRDTRNLDLPRTVAVFRYFGGMADKLQGSVIPVEQGLLNYVVREPLGVVGQIVPWNFPVMFTSWKMGPALAAGNCVVLKPAELTPLSSLKIAELVREVGFPAGVVNIIPGYGNVAGQYLAAHPQVHKIAFTGSTMTGRKIVEASAGNLKRVQLELGGKGANIVFDDADLNAAINGSAFAIFHNQGQACIAGSRLLLHEKIADQFLDGFLKLAASIKLGNPLDPATEMGPLTSTQHRDRVLGYCKIAQEQGGEIILGGKAPADSALAPGCYVMPTVVRARPTDRVCQEEVFGPFVAVSTFRDDAEVIEIANGTSYGLGGGLWTSNLQRAHLIARHMITGMVWINCYKRFNPGSPFGGVRGSGYGRDMGFEAMTEYTTPKSVWVNVDAKIPPFYAR
ncbi:MAG: aldehyde dehydrogenase family protein [Candidatus Binatus sp.]|uniref:aldehyde dehydrogenase family protein n=1 Tax=Candidatus Binatus sp. TaxID=2811406 RepID=UPI00271A0042|nr:aldehyde dehydrogenase family protein [Candidatus Binatus sp.]MDO8434733.1 aldehyde dehydrogenase family protein [Candidatus Binatus sp.]